MLCFSEINYSLVDSFQHIYVCVDASTHTKNYLLVGGVAEHGWVSERRDTFRSQSSVRKKKKMTLSFSVLSLIRLLNILNIGSLCIVTL